MWHTERDGVLMLAPPARNLTAECRVHRTVPTELAQVPARKMHRTSSLTRRPADLVTAASPPAELAPAPRQLAPAPPRTPDLAALVERARPLMPLGRGELAKALGVTPHWARRVLDELGRERGT